MAGRPPGTHNTVDLDGVHYYLTTKKYPDTVGKTQWKKANFRRQANKFTIVDGKLHKYRGKRGNGNDTEVDGAESAASSDHKKLRVIIDKEERQQILRFIHEGEDETLEPRERNRHFGQDKTEVRLLDRYWWPGIRGDVRKFVNSCVYCQCHKTDRRSLKGCTPTEGQETQYPRQSLNQSSPQVHRCKGGTDRPTEADPVHSKSGLLPALPWERIGVEVCEMPESKEGYSSLAIVVDYFSKWIEAEPLRSKTAEGVADFLYRLICRHGCADVQIIDSDKEFTGKVSKHLHDIVGVWQNVTNTYHSRASELFDTYSNLIQELLVKVLNNPNDVSDWPKALPGVLFTFRTNMLPSSGFSPFYLLYGRHPRLPSRFDNETLCDTDEDPRLPVHFVNKTLCDGHGTDDSVGAGVSHTVNNDLPCDADISA